MTHRFWKHRGRAVIAACTLLLAVGLGGCSTDHVTDPDEVDNSRTIRFTPAVKSSGVPGTRAAAGHPIENGKNIPSGGSFGVYAYHRPNPTGTVTSYAAELANNTKVTNSGTAFTYSPIAKWPGQAGEQLAFYGYYPWQDPSTTPVAGDPVIAANPIAANAISLFYTTPADPAKHVDLMYAYTPFTGGFAPVNMEFHHALTRVNFKGKVEDYTVPVQITSITVKKVKSKAALMTILSSSNTYWTTPNTDTNMVLTPGNGLVANPILTSTLSWVSQPGSTSETAGDLLVIPQSVQGMEVVVEAMIDGSPETFTFPLKDTPDWVMNQIVTYEITISGSGMRLVARFSADWNDNAIGVIEDGQWWMYVEEDDLVLSMGGGSETVHAETNYDISSQGSPAGLSVEVPSQYGSWLSVAASGSPGDLTRSFAITATPTSTARTGEVHITAGNLTKIVKVSQSIARQFARSNIVWDATNNKLTFAVTAADNATIPANVQGVFFKWGSLVAISPVGNTYAANQILFSPDGTTNYTWANIPYISETTGKFGTHGTDEDDFAGYDGGSNTNGPGYATSGTNANKGDICRYISDRGWVEGKWRLPTADEMQALLAEVTNDYHSVKNGGTFTTLPSGAPDGINGYGDHTNGFYQALSGRWLGIGAVDLATRGTEAVPGSSSVYFPAGGFQSTTGSTYGVGDSGGSWSASSNNMGNADYLGVNKDSAYGNNNNRSRGLTVRCVRE